eukprot:3928138-Rhodomonas_salina.1
MSLGLPAFVDRLKQTDKGYFMDAVNNTIPSGSGFRDVQQQAHNLLRHKKITGDDFDETGKWVHERANSTRRFNNRDTPQYETGVWAPGIKEVAEGDQGKTFDQIYEELKRDMNRDKKKEREKNVAAAHERTYKNPKYQVVSDGKGGYRMASMKTAYTAAVNYLISQPPSQL